jgi:hypothetical protein
MLNIMNSRAIEYLPELGASLGKVSHSSNGLLITHVALICNSSLNMEKGQLDLIFDFGINSAGEIRLVPHVTA